MLDKSALFFPRVDKLTAADPFEGYYTKSIVAIDQLKLEDFPEEWRKQVNINDEKSFQMFVEHHRVLREHSKLQREVTFVNSWHCQEHESAAMWSLYLKTQEGIAIQSSYERLIESLSQYSDFGVYIGMVNYIDYELDAISLSHGLYPFIHKRKSFEHEKELRALIWTIEHGKNASGANNKFKDVDGLNVPVNLNALIERVFVAPTAPVWVRELIESIVKRFGLSASVVQSKLLESPFY